MSKAYLNELGENGSRAEIFEWLCRLDRECDALKEQLWRKDNPSKFHGERVEERQKERNFGAC